MLRETDRVTPAEFQRLVRREEALVIDVRPEVETSICSLPGSVNLPFDTFDRRAEEFVSLVRSRINGPSPLHGIRFVFFIFYYHFTPRA